MNRICLVLQDMLVPIADLKSSIEMFHSEVEIYPIWLCPFKLPSHPGMLKPHTNKVTNYGHDSSYGDKLFMFINS